MGSFIEINDTLRISKEQGFPKELNIQTHLTAPYNIEELEGRVFTFQAKSKIRVYQQPPVRNFLAEEIDGKWLYWGKCYVLEVHHDYVQQETSGTYKILSINAPKDMRNAFDLLDLRPEINYFND